MLHRSTKKVLVRTGISHEEATVLKEQLARYAALGGSNFFVVFDFK